MKKITVSIAEQTLTLFEESKPIKTYSISTALNGAGELENTGCTPRGQHVIAEKFGDGLPANAVFVGREFTQEIYTEELGKDNPDRDWILSRILWLDGCEAGKNKGNASDGQVCDSKARYIYIHGTPDTEPMGVAKSHGCVRMRNEDVIELFDWVDCGTHVEITEG